MSSKVPTLMCPKINYIQNFRSKKNYKFNLWKKLVYRHVHSSSEFRTYYLKQFTYQKSNMKVLQIHCNWKTLYIHAYIMNKNDKSNVKIKTMDNKFYCDKSIVTRYKIVEKTRNLKS